MGIMELVAFVHSDFGVQTAPEELVVENFGSIRKLAEFVRRKLPPPVPEKPELSVAG